jgi:hypothetical protein
MGGLNLLPIHVPVNISQIIHGLGLLQSSHLALTKMVEVTYNLSDLDQDIRLKLECVASDHKYKRICRGIKENRMSVSEKSALELELDINKIQELPTMCMWPLVRNLLALITQGNKKDIFFFGALVFRPVSGVIWGAD